MHLIYFFSVIGALVLPCRTYEINWKGSAMCLGSHNRIQSLYNIVNAQMSEKALFSKGQTIACSRIGVNGLSGKSPFGGIVAEHNAMCTWISNGGGFAYNKAKILSLLGNLLQAPLSGNSCGSVPINYPLLNNSYNALTVNYVYHNELTGVNSAGQDPQGVLSVNDRGYAPGRCTVNFVQYQNFTGDGSPGTFVKAGQPASTHLDVQIIDANQLLIGETWFQETLSNQTWSLPSQMPLMLVIRAGALQSDPITFAYNGGGFTTSGRQCSLSDANFQSVGRQIGVRYGSCGFTCP